MISQQSNQQNLSNNLPDDISPARKVYAVKDLPANVRENLVRLQNTDGDFLKVGYLHTYTSGVLLTFLSIGLLLFFADLVEFFLDYQNTVFNLKWAVVLAGGALVFALCFLDLFRRFLRGRRSPVKTGIYLTPTQVIETFDGLIRYRELKDASEISLDKFQGGWSTSLDVKFADGDLYKYKLFMNLYGASIPRLTAEGEKWQGKAELWKNEALGAAQRGETAYFDLRDIIQKSATENLSVFNKYLSPLRLMNLMFIMTMGLILYATIVFYAIKISGE